MNKTIASLFLVIFIYSPSVWAVDCTPADLTFCSFPTSGFKVGRINDLDLGEGSPNVDISTNQLQIDIARFRYDETRIHTNAFCNTSETNLVGEDIEIAFSLDEGDPKRRTISEIWILPCNAVQLR